MLIKRRVWFDCWRHIRYENKDKAVGGKSFMSFYICLNSAILKSQKVAEISDYIVHFKFSVDLMEVLGINDEQ